MRRRHRSAAGPWRSRRVVDLGTAGVLFAAAELEVLLDGLGPLSAGLAALGSVPLAARRRAPVLSFACVAGLTPTLDRALGATWAENANALVFLILVASYSVAAHAPLRRSLTAVLAVLAWLVAIEALWGPGDGYGFLLLLIGMPWISGRGVRTYRRQTERLRELAGRLEQERAAGEQLAVARERQRIAHEAHDAIAHAVGVMTLQAAGAEEVLEREPERARRALGAVQDTGRESVRELREVLGILRAGDERGRPQPSAPVDSIRPSPPRSRSWPAETDAVLAAILLALGVTYALTSTLPAGTRAALVLPQLVAAAAVALRGRRPLPALALALVAFAGESVLLGGDPSSPATLAAALLATFSAAAHADRGGAAVAALLVLGTLSAVGLMLEHADAIDLLLPLTMIAIPWLSGRVVAAHRRQGEALVVLTEQLQRERAASARLAVLEERARVARELHDSVAHAISVMVLQAGAAEQVLGKAPEQAREAIGAVQSVGRVALDELGRLLGVLDAGDSAAARVPSPGIAQLEGLLDSVRRAGLPVSVRVLGEPAELPHGVDGAAYRVIQESLTNALKHAGAAPTTITLRYACDGVRLQIADDGRRRRPVARAGPGHGLAGMRERVAHVGGELQAGRRPGGRGFVVDAFLPYAVTRDRQLESVGA